jgi:hypothetical protein
MYSLALQCFPQFLAYSPLLFSCYMQSGSGEHTLLPNVFHFFFLPAFTNHRLGMQGIFILGIFAINVITALGLIALYGAFYSRKRDLLIPVHFQSGVLAQVMGDHSRGRVSLITTSRWVI